MTWWTCRCLWIVTVVCHVAVHCSLADAQNGTYNSPCNVNSDCQVGLGLVCLQEECTCDYSYFYDKKELRCKKVCRGTDLRGYRYKDYYSVYKELFTNCSYVNGNLKIIYLNERKYPFGLGFLKDIEEVYGYLYVSYVYLSYLNLTKLRIVRGNEMFKQNRYRYSMVIHLSNLKELKFKSLTEVTDGDVWFWANDWLCFVETINWKDTAPNSFVLISQDSVPSCTSCPENCYNNATKSSHCWGSSPDMCQNLNYISEVCGNCRGRCFAKNMCCHPECAAGCTGPLNTDCLACKNFYNDDGTCLASCPEGRYTLGSLCVKVCPGYTEKKNSACVIKSQEGNDFDNTTNICPKYNGTSFKKCAGISEYGFLNSTNIGDFQCCTYVDGNVRILAQSFERSSNFTDVLSTLKDVKEIDGFVFIEGTPPELRDLGFLSGLEVIHGHNLSSGVSLSIQNTELEFLGLTSLQRINNGMVDLANNRYLCYLENLDMSLIFANTSQRLLRKANRNESECEKRGLQCSYNCVGHGCWGPGTDKCLKCENMIINITDDNICLEGCGNMSLVYIDENKCPQACHELCKSGCSGPVHDNCLQCKYVKVPFHSRFLCASKCPPDLYPDENNVCRKCDLACYNGCTGPSSVLKRGGCNRCVLAISGTPENDSLSCLPRDQKYCSKGYYKQQNKDDDLFKEICKPCDGQCTVCYGPGNNNCSECKTLRFLNSTCVSECPSNSFLQDDECIPCHDQCTGGCHGTSNTDCVKCLNFKIFLSEEKKSFVCVNSCPSHLPMRREDQDKSSKAVCVSENGSTNVTSTSATTFATAGTAVAILFSCIVITLCVVFWWRRKEQRAKLSSLEQMNKDDSPFSAEEPLSLTDVKPDKSKLRIIKESELRRGGEIGRGAFGVVYKGFWVPDGENVKIPVAIKVIREGNSSSLHQELLDEARIMVSVVHICCIRLLAVCMASEKMMMISQLMPLGCLLGYIKKHRDMIGSKPLLNWCAQIARGMVYLEERGIVHRDLAARNILVQSAAQVKITDFGLAKLLDYKEDEFQSAEEKVPVRWLAPESLQSRIYSHKSDVWSYGVTLWEMFTYGKRPYEKSQNRDVLSLIEKGDRLPQPDICTIDVYMIMIKCWMYNAENRPSFKELAEDFSKMARDPGRYLVIQGDEMMKTPTQLDSINDLDLEMDACADGPEKLITADNYIKIEPPVHEKCNETTRTEAEVDLDADGYLKTVAEPHIYLDLEGNGDEYIEMKERHFTMDGRNGDKRRLLKSEYEPAGSLKSEYENDPSSLKYEYVKEAGFRESEYEPAGFPGSKSAHADTAVLEDIQRQHKSASTSHSKMD